MPVDFDIHIGGNGDEQAADADAGIDVGVAGGELRAAEVEFEFADGEAVAVAEFDGVRGLFNTAAR